MSRVFEDLYEIIDERKNQPQEGSYTAYLFEQGLDKILKKVGEECAETIIAAKNGGREEIVAEAADLLYHVLVMLRECEIPFEELAGELERRREKLGNLKTIKTVDKET